MAAFDPEAERTRDLVERAMFGTRAAEVCDERLDDGEAAIGRCKKVLALDEKYAPALSTLGRLYYGKGRWEDLLSTYQLELAVTAPGASTAALLYKMGELAEERLGRDDEAIRRYRAATEADARHLTAIRALVRLESARGQWKEVVKLLELERKAIDDKPTRARAAFRIGEVYEHRIEDRMRALEAYDRALVDVPNFFPAVDGRTRLLERAKEYRTLVEWLAAGRPPTQGVGRRRKTPTLRSRLGSALRRSTGITWPIPSARWLRSRRCSSSIRITAVAL